MWAVPWALQLAEVHGDPLHLGMGQGVADRDRISAGPSRIQRLELGRLEVSLVDDGRVLHIVEELVKI